MGRAAQLALVYPNAPPLQREGLTSRLDGNYPLTPQEPPSCQPSQNRRALF